MPKRELSKCREWERERRERLKTCFDALARLLPSHDPTLTPSKLEILQRAATHITDLQQKNKELLLGDQRSTAVAQRDEVRRLRERVRKLNARTEQLAGLMRTAGLKIPKECISRANNSFKGPPRLWSGRLSREKAETIRKEHENDLKNEETTKPKRKRKRLSTPKTSENTPPSVKKPKQVSKSPKKCPKKTVPINSASLASKVATVLGPGTLILANGSVVPVPPPSGTLHRIQIVPTVTQNKVILMPNTSTTAVSTNTASTKLPILRPKTVGSLKQNLVAAKVAIPPLTKKKTAIKKNKPVTKTATTLEPTKKVEPAEEVTEKSEETDKENDKPEETKEPPKEPEKPEPVKQPEPENESLKLPENDSTDHQEHSELSNDIFASLGGAGDSAGMIGAQHTESMSPTAAFLLAFPLVSTLTGSKLSDSTNTATNANNSSGNTGLSSNTSNNDRSDEGRQSNTPTTLLQIGGTMNLDNKNSNSSTRVLQISDPINIDKTTSKLDSFDYTYSSTCQQQNRIQYDNKEPLISSVLQVSHACLYEKTSQNNFYNHYSADIQDNYNNLQTNNHLQINSATNNHLQPGHTSNNHLQINSATNNNTHATNNHLPSHTSSNNLLQVNNNVQTSNHTSNNNNSLRSSHSTNNNMQTTHATNRLQGNHATNNHLQINHSATSNNVQPTSNNGQTSHVTNSLQTNHATNNHLQINSATNNNVQPTNNSNHATNSLQANHATNNLQGNHATNNNVQPTNNSVQATNSLQANHPNNRMQSNHATNNHLQINNSATNNSVQTSHATSNLQANHATNNLQSNHLQINNSATNNNVQPTNNSNSLQASHATSSLQVNRATNNHLQVNSTNSTNIQTNHATNSHLQMNNSATNNSVQATTSLQTNHATSRLQSNHATNNHLQINNSATNSNVQPTNNSLQASHATSSLQINRATNNHLQINNSATNSSVQPTNNSNSLQASHSTSSLQVNRATNNHLQVNSTQPNQATNTSMQTNTSLQINQSTNNQQSNATTLLHTNAAKETVKSSPKNRHKSQNQRPPVNWMTTPDPRSSFTTSDSQVPGITSDYFLPPFSDVYSGISTAMSSENNEQSWNATNRAVLPTLLGDLALGVTNTAVTTKTTTSTSGSNQYYNPFDITPNQNKESNFLSVSSILVGGKPNKKINTNQKRHKPKTKMCANDFEGKKYSGGYSAEELISDTQYHGRSNNYLDNSGQFYQPQQQNRQNQGYQRQQLQQQPPYPQHGEFTALLSAAVADSYSKTFDSFHVKSAVTNTGYEGYCSGGSHHRTHTSSTGENSDRRRHNRRSGTQSSANVAATTNTGFSELSFLSMSGAISSPILPDDFHASSTFLTNAPPPIPTPVPSSLTNFNLSAIFPEINKGATPSSASAAPPWPHSKPPVSSTRSQTRYQHQNQQINNHEPVHQHRDLPEGGKPSGGYCHPQQLPHDGIFGSSGSFLTHHHQMQNNDVTSAPTNFSFSFAP